MNPIVPPIAKLLAILTVIADVGIVFYLLMSTLSMKFKPIKKFWTNFLRGVASNSRIFAFIIALTAMSGSLFYSEVAKYTPCILCWWQRILMYPETLLLIIGIVKSDRNIADYIMGMSGVGALIAGYHYYIQLGGNKFIPCTAVGFSVDCSQRFSLEFGYITIPMMALSAFIAIFLLMYTLKRYGSTKK